MNQLEEFPFIAKKIYSELPPKVEYSLTGLGQSVLPIVIALRQWGDDHQDHLRKVIALDLVASATAIGVPITADNIFRQIRGKMEKAI
jgi:DNA-binding HxlR family transcriptional regulator